jgi:PKD repeat protein
MSLITVGPTLSQGTVIYTLRFNAVGAPGSVSPVNFTGSAQPQFWNNGFGWSGNNFNAVNGSVTLICGQPSAVFGATANLYNYTFNNTSSGGGTYFWDFGDGNTSTQASPSHTYATSGTYTVCMVATNNCGADSVCHTYNVCPLPSATFNHTGNQLQVNFNGASPNGPHTWHWDFGDGNTATTQNPVHNYAMPGNYTVCLIVDNGCAADTFCQGVTVGCPAPVAAWSDSTSDLTAVFIDMSTSNPTSWFWDFGDGTFSSLPSPFHTYAAPGTYTVCLIASSVCGADTSCGPVTVTCAAPQAAFSSFINGATVDFTDLSTVNPTSWQWDFGDGNTSTSQNPSHTYAADGSYLACLEASSICGSSTSCDTIVINTVSIANGLHNDFALQYAADLSAITISHASGHAFEWNLMAAEGRILRSGNQASLELRREDLPAGIYFLSLQIEDQTAVRKVMLR